AGQGANNGSKMAKNLVESIVARGDRAFDDAWIIDTFERFWERHGRHSAALTNMLLAPPTNMAKADLVAQYGSDGRAERSDGAQLLADAFAENFADPALLMPTLLDGAKTKAFIEKTTGSFWGSLARSAPGIASAQVRQRLGRDPGFPQAPMA